MAVVVKLGDPKNRPSSKSSAPGVKGAAVGATAQPTGFRLPFGEGDEWFHDRRVLGGIGAGLAVGAIAWGLFATQAAKGPYAGVKPSAPRPALTAEESAAAAAARTRPTLPNGYDADPDNATSGPVVDPRAAAADPTPDD